MLNDRHKMHHVNKLLFTLEVVGYIMATAGRKKGLSSDPVEKLSVLILACSTHDPLHLVITFGNETNKKKLKIVE